MSDPRPLTDGEQIAFANILNAMKDRPVLACMYRNYRGEVSERRFQVSEFWHGSTEWHPEPCLLLRAFDLGKQAERDFRVLDFDTSTLRILEREPKG